MYADDINRADEMTTLLVVTAFFFKCEMKGGSVKNSCEHGMKIELSPLLDT
jgi:hypothetical protein